MHLRHVIHGRAIRGIKPNCEPGVVYEYRHVLKNSWQTSKGHGECEDEGECKVSGSVDTERWVKRPRAKRGHSLRILHAWGAGQSHSHSRARNQAHSRADTCRSRDCTWICALGTTLAGMRVFGLDRYLCWCVDVHRVSNFADAIGYFLELSLSSARDDHFRTRSSQTKRTAMSKRRYREFSRPRPRKQDLLLLATSFYSLASTILSNLTTDSPMVLCCARTKLRRYRPTRLHTHEGKHMLIFEY